MYVFMYARVNYVCLGEKIQSSIKYVYMSVVDLVFSVLVY